MIDAAIFLISIIETMAHPHLKYLIVFAIALFDTCAVGRSNFFNARCTNLAFVVLPRIRDKHLHEDLVMQAVERRYSSDLDTAYEWLANDRFSSEREQSCGKRIKWFDPDYIYVAEDKDERKNDDGIDVKRMPLYPLGAVHIPHSGENHTLINIEPKNVKMGQDLVNGLWEDNLFCTSLRAKDTNRIASVGTIMQLIDTEDRSINEAKTWPGKLLTHNRVVVNCKPAGIADIISIEGNEYGEDDYLIANVRVHALPKESNEDGNESHDASASRGNEKLNSIAAQLVEDYQQVRSIYINSKSLASNELPKYAQNAVQTLPTFDHDTVCNERKFWQMIETWQMLCNTIRQSKRTRLQSIVNELSVSVAMQAKGPLELPVKRKSLPKEVQTQLENLEESAAKDFIELGMEPVLDFQELITMRNHWDRVEKLSGMIQRERLRLEAKESIIRAFFDEELLGEELITGGKMNDDNNIFD